MQEAEASSVGACRCPGHDLVMRHGESARSDLWVAIDFETASSRGTPCSAGLAVVESGRIIDCHSWLIRPPVFEFWGFNVALHGITPEMCEHALGWEDSLAKILEIAAVRPPLAHNTSFDMGVVRDACDLAGVEWPRLRYACTVVIGRHVRPGLPTYSLPFLAAHLGLVAESHHDAREDAAVAARIALAALEATQVSSLEGLAERARVAMGVVDPDLWRGCRSHTDSSMIPSEPTLGVVTSPRHPLFGRTVVFTYRLSSTASV